MSNNKGLGKGLGALISLFDEDIEELGPKGAPASPKSGGQSDQDPIKAGATEIAIDLIDNNSSQPRRVFNSDELAELEQSIRANGVIQPILLQRVGSRYMIVAGERRWRASKNVGLKTIPALVRDYTNKQVAEIALVENLMRSDLNEIEVALGIKKLVDAHGMTQEQVSKVLGISRSAVANYLRYLGLPTEVQKMLEANQISAGHAKILAGIENVIQCLSLARSCASGMSVRELEAAVQNVKVNAGAINPKLRQSLELKQFELALTHMFATKVSIAGNDSKGKIVIEYASQKDLERIMKKCGQ
ncbi:MAG: ParB/RepB/Spo0J family partition protein [Firmicutes bacterium]|nr:ParB/RepB/Spo0J family partition protein [Bacillota bacterium]